MSIDAWWRSYSKQVLGDPDCPAQLIYARKVFYAGATAAHREVLEALRDGYVTAAGRERLIALDDEIRRHVEAVLGHHVPPMIGDGGG